MPPRLRAYRNRWGIAAPRLTVRTHIAWYWWLVALAALLAIALATGAWMYDAGRRSAGFDARVLEGEVAELRRRIADYEAEARRLRTGSASSESRLQIEKTAGAQLGRQLKAAEAEIQRLREDLAFFDNLAVRDAGDETLVVSRFKVERDALPGEYHYRVLLTQGGRKEREFKGRLQFVVNTELRGRDITVVIPSEKVEERTAYRISFRRILRAEGAFQLDPGATVRSVQVRIFEQGADQPRVTHNYTMS